MIGSVVGGSSYRGKSLSSGNLQQSKSLYEPRQMAHYRQHRKITHQGYLLIRCFREFAVNSNGGTPPNKSGRDSHCKCLLGTEQVFPGDQKLIPPVAPMPPSSPPRASSLRQRSNNILTFPSTRATSTVNMMARPLDDSLRKTVGLSSPSPQPLPPVVLAGSTDSGGIGAALADFQSTGSIPSSPSGPIAGRESNGTLLDESSDEDGIYSWVRKYCILEDGILYFYVDEAVAHSPEAREERMPIEDNDDLSDCCPDGLLNRSSTGGEIDELGNKNGRPDYPSSLASSPVSPTVPVTFGNRVPMSCNFGEAPIIESSDIAVQFMWERRVPINLVNSVRSEEEYGKHSFMLLTELKKNRQHNLSSAFSCSVGLNAQQAAVEPFFDTEGVACDNLVLRAASSEDMNLWLFQFHQSIAAVVAKMMASVKKAGRKMAPLGVTSEAIPIFSNGTPHRAEKKTDHRGAQHEETAMSLSHGHGRHGLHRRRARANSNVRPSSYKSEASGGILNRGDEFNNEISGNDLKSNSLLSGEQSMEIKAPFKDKAVIETLPPTKSAGSAGGKYVPPHRRKSTTTTPFSTDLDSYSTEKNLKSDASPLYTAEEDFFKLEDSGDFAVSTATNFASSTVHVSPDPIMPFVQLGGCALEKTDTTDSTRDKFGSFGGGANGHVSATFQWEVGSASERGVRKSNEDSYVCVSDYATAVRDGRGGDACPRALFAIFDGHCGTETAQYAAENLSVYLSSSLDQPGNMDIENCLHESLKRLDKDFCHLCTEGGNDWDCGATALVAAVTENTLVIANIGDCRGVIARSSEDDTAHSEKSGWNVDKVNGDSGNGGLTQSYWREVTDIHKADRDDEKERIISSNGWLVMEQEVCISQLQRLDLYDEDVQDIISRCFSERMLENSHAIPGRQMQIVRVCGELAVSRALGDKDFKSAYNERVEVKKNLGQPSDGWWRGPNYLLYPNDHNQAFVGDIVSATPELQTLTVGQDGTSDEFLLLASDGLWDVMDMEDAVRVSRGLLFEKGVSAKDAAARLAELAIHLGSSDNVTVILVRFFRE